jgi:MFS family permease
MLASVFRFALGTALGQIYPVEWRGKLLALPNTIDMLMRMFILAGAGWILRHDLEARRVLFPLAGLCVIAGALVFRKIPGSRGLRRTEGGPDPDPFARRIGRSLRSIRRNRLLVGFLSGYFLATCGGVLFTNTLPLYADYIGLDTAQWGYAAATFLLATLISFWAWGIFMDRFGAPLTMLVCWTFMGLLMGAVALVSSWPSFFIVVAVRGIFMSGNLIAFFPIVMHFTDPSETPRGMALHSSLWGIRWVLMPLAVIVVVDGEVLPMRWLFLVTICLVAAGLAVMARIWWADRRRAPEII